MSNKKAAAILLLLVLACGLFLYFLYVGTNVANMFKF